MRKLPGITASLMLSLCSASGWASSTNPYTFDVTVTLRQEIYISQGVLQIGLFPDPDFLGDSFQYTLDLNDWESAGWAYGFKDEITFRSPYWAELSALKRSGIETDFLGSFLASDAYVDNEGFWRWDLLGGVPKNYFALGSYDYGGYSQSFVDAENFNNYRIFEHSEGFYRDEESGVPKIIFQAVSVYADYKDRYSPESETSEEFENEFHQISYYGFATLRPVEVHLPGTLTLFVTALVSLGLMRLRGSSGSR